MTPSDAGRGVEPEEFARRILGVSPDAEADIRVVEGVAAANSRPCVRCGALPDRVVFDVETAR